MYGILNSTNQIRDLKITAEWIITPVPWFNLHGYKFFGETGQNLGLKKFW